MPLITSLDVAGPLVPHGGVCAFDPVTFAVAVRELSEQHGYTVFAPDLVTQLLPESLVGLAEIAFDERRQRITVSIDTGHMSWNLKESGFPWETDLTDDRGRSRRGLAVGACAVACVDGRYATCLPMRTAEGRDVLIWFAEIDPAEVTANRADLLVTASGLQGSWERMREAGELVWAGAVTVPELDLRYSTELPCVRVAQWEPTYARQKFEVSVDVTGARAYAETAIMVTGVPDFRDILEVTFGSRGPLLVWFSPSFDDGASQVLPFCVVRVSSDAFLEADVEDEDVEWGEGEEGGLVPRTGL